MARHAAAGRIDRQSLPSRGLIIGLALGLGGIGIAVLIALIAVLARGGASSGSATATQAPAVASAGQQAVPTGGQSKPGEGDFKRPAGAVRIGDILLSGVSVRTLDVRPTEPHLKYVAIEVTVQNVGTRPQEIGVFRLKDSDGAFASRGSSDAELANQLKNLESEIVKLWGTTLAPGETIRGVAVFKILKDTKPAELQYTSDAKESGVIPLK